MKVDLERLNRTIERLRREWAGDPNVHSIGMALRERAGERTDEICIVFSVRRKLRRPEEIEAARSRPIPAEIDGFPTDVRVHTLRRVSDMTGERDERKYNPLVGGPATSNAEQHVWLFNGNGTLGGLGRDGSGRPIALSNWHVWGDGGEEGDDIIQPGHPTGGDHLEALGKVALCGPLVTSLIEWEVPSPLTGGLYGGAAAAAIAAAASDAADPIRRGQAATPVDPGERTLDEKVDMAIEYLQLPIPGRPFQVLTRWTYERHTDRRTLTHEVEEVNVNPHFLLAKRAWVDKADYRPGEGVQVWGAIWDYVPRPCDAYHVVAHLIPRRDPSRVLRAVLYPAPCPDDIPGDPAGQETCVDFGRLKPGRALGQTEQFAFLTVASLDGDGLRLVDWYPAAHDGLPELRIPGRNGLVFSHAPARRVRARVAHFNRPVTLSALDAAGNVIATAASPATQGVAHELTVEGSHISRTTITGGGGEGVVLEYCVTPAGAEEGFSPEGYYAAALHREVERIVPSYLSAGLRVQPHRFADMPLSHTAGTGTAGFTHGHYRLSRCCFTGRAHIPPTEAPGPWDVYLVVQNVNNAPADMAPEDAARIIGGHVLSNPTSEVLGCLAIMLADHVFDVI